MQGETTAALQHARKVLACRPHGAHNIITGCEGGSVHIWDGRKTAAPVASISNAHASRVRGLVTDLQRCGIRGAAPCDAAQHDRPTQAQHGGTDADAAPESASGHSGGDGCFATASSDGRVKLWQFAAAVASGDAGVAPLATIDVGARFTGLCAVHRGGSGAAGAASGAAVQQAKKSGKRKRHVRAHERATAHGGDDVQAQGDDNLADSGHKQQSDHQQRQQRQQPGLAGHDREAVGEGAAKHKRKHRHAEGDGAKAAKHCKNASAANKGASAAQQASGKVEVAGAASAAGAEHKTQKRKRKGEKASARKLAKAA